MNDKGTSLSPRYYIAENSIWVLGGILVLSRFVGLAPGQSLPVLDVVPENSQHFPKIVAAFLVAAVLYMIVEWKQCSRTARGSTWAQARAVASALWACVSLWLSYPIIAQATRFAGISPAWYLGFAAIGFALGALVTTLAFSALMIRSPEEVKRIRLPRVPAATRAQFVVWIPVVVLLVIGYYVLLYLSPKAIHGVAWLFVGVPFLLMIGEEFASLFFARDEDGNPIPYAKRIAPFKEIHDFHDYARFLIKHGEGIVAKHLQIPSTASPRDIQKAVQSAFSVDADSKPIHFHVQLQEVTQFLFYPKDGNPANESPENRGVRIRKRTGKKGLLRVLVIPDDSAEESREMEIPMALLDAHAEEYAAGLSGRDLTLRKVLSYAVNQTVIKTMMEEAGPLLYRAATAGDEKMIRELLGKDIDVNERAEFGWTALLAASAQGYPQIVRLLLDAGADPDIGNVHGITALMYGARYGNMHVCQILLKYGSALDIQDMYGMTPLMAAARDGHVKVVKWLLESGADPAIKTRDGVTALDFAHANKQGKIAKRLRQANKRTQTTK